MENTLPKNGLKFMNRNVLKYIAIIAMFLDHATIAFIPSDHFLYVPFRFVSRITATTMTFFIAEGYIHTHDVKAYIKRLFIFSLVSWLPFVYFEHGTFMPFELIDGFVQAGAGSIYLQSVGKTFVVYYSSMIYTLFLGIVTILMWDKGKFHVVAKVLITVLICWLATFGDWSFFAVLFCLCFWGFRDKPVYKWITFTVIGLMYVFNIDPFRNNSFIFDLTGIKFYLYRMGFVLAIPLLALCYNGKAGKKNSINKWFFYIFYPAHLIIIDILKEIF